MVGLIALLAAIGVTVAVSMTVQARNTQVRAMMDGLKGVSDEYRKINKQNINEAGSYPINWNRVTNSENKSSIERFVYAASANQTTNTMMQAAVRSSGETTFKKTFIISNGFNDAFKNNKPYFAEIRDRWGTQIEYRASNNGEGTGPGTGVRNDDLPLSPSPILVAAGKDKKFGTDDDISTEDAR